MADYTFPSINCVCISSKLSNDMFHFSMFGFIRVSRPPTLLKMQNTINNSLVLKMYFLQNHKGNKENNEKQTLKK